MTTRYRLIMPTVEFMQWGNNSQASTPENHVEAKPGNDPRVIYDPSKIAGAYVMNGKEKVSVGFGDWIGFWSHGLVEVMHPEQFDVYIKRFETVPDAEVKPA